MRGATTTVPRPRRRTTRPCCTSRCTACRTVEPADPEPLGQLELVVEPLAWRDSPALDRLRQALGDLVVKGIGLLRSSGPIVMTLPGGARGGYVPLPEGPSSGCRNGAGRTLHATFPPVTELRIGRPRITGLRIGRPPITGQRIGRPRITGLRITGPPITKAQRRLKRQRPKLSRCTGLQQQGQAEPDDNAENAQIQNAINAHVSGIAVSDHPSLMNPTIAKAVAAESLWSC